VPLFHSAKVTLFHLVSSILECCQHPGNRKTDIMRFITLLLLLFSCGLSAQNNHLNQDDTSVLVCIEGGCVVNAGQAQVICPDGNLELRGESNVDFATPLNAVWEANPGNPAPLTIDNPNELVSSVSNDGTNYPPGIYTFSLTVTCADGSTSCSETEVTVVELPDIQLIVPEVPECSNSVFLARSEALPDGVTESLVFQFASNFSIEEVEGGFLVSRTVYGGCIANFVYTIFAGTSCRKAKTGTFNIVAPANFGGLSPGNITCNDNLLTGSFFLDNQNIQCSSISVVPTSIPDGVNLTDVLISDPGSPEQYNFSAPAGDYTFEVSLENECGTETLTIDVGCPEVQECSRISSSGGVLPRFFCGRLGDIPSFVDLAVPEYNNARYVWTPTLIPDWVTYELFTNDGPTASFLLTSDQPSNNNDIAIRFKVFVYDELSPECPPATFTSSISVPTPIGVVNNQVNINCGAGSVYSISNNLNTNFSASFQILSYPAGYAGQTSGSTSNSSGILQLNQIGSYYIELRRREARTDYLLDELVTCEIREYFTIIVDDIPNIDAGSDAVICGDNVQLNGSTPRNSNGDAVDINILWEPVEDYPGVTISDPTIRNPTVTGLEPGQSYTFRYAFPGDPNCEKEDLVTITVDKQCPPEPEPLTCDLTLKSRCGACGCGEPVFTVYAYDSNGDRMDGDRFFIEWFVDGEPFTTSNTDGYISSHYDGPLVVTAMVTFELPSGIKCQVEESIAITCGKDCPIVDFEYSTDDCDDKGGFYGDVTIVDQAGHLLYGAGIDWYIDGQYDDNPYTLYAQQGESVPVFLNFFSPTRCEQKLEFTPECGKGKVEEKGKKYGTYNHDAVIDASVYPNPAGRGQSLEINFGKSSPSSLRVVDLSGRQVFQTFIKSGEEGFRFSPSSLPTGVLVVVLHDADGRVLTSRRFVVK
jgi:hypothetical protein